MKWLVISDIHSAIHDFPTVNAQAKLLNKIKEEEQESGFDFILVTGDSMDRCKDSELAIKYIKLIMDTCKIDSSHIFICPGNHDILRSSPENKTPRNEAIDEIRKGKLDKVYYLVLDGANSFPWREEYNIFSALYRNIKGDEYVPFKMFEPEGEEYRIISIDSCLFSKDDNDANNLFVCTPQLMNLSLQIPDDHKLNIVMMHHGVAFLNQDDARRFENWLADYNVDVVYCGHNHRTGMAVLADAICLEKGSSIHRIREFTCGACHVNEMQKTEATFFVCEYMEDEKAIKTKAFHFASSISNWCKDTSSTRPFYEGENIYKVPRKNKEDSKSVDLFGINKSFDRMCVADEVFDDPIDAEPKIKQLISNTEFLYYMGIKGDSIYDDYHGIARLIADHHELDVRFLLANPCSQYLEERLLSLPDYNTNRLKLEKHWSELYKKGLTLYEECEKEENWNVRYHNEPVLFRMYIFSQCMLMSFYLPDEHSKNSPLYEFNSSSRMYKAFKLLFEEKWRLGNSNKPEIDLEHTFLNWEYDIVPTLVLNVSDQCNFKCYYCPDGGENLHCAFDESEFVGLKEIYALMEAYIRSSSQFVPKHKYVLRITGGEPLINVKTREKVYKIIEKAKQLGFQKIVMCTNGIFIEEAYKEAMTIWNEVKEEMLLKISVDTLRPETLRKISRVDDEYNLIGKIKKGISTMKALDFSIELNTVITRYNLEELEEIYKFACDEKIIGVKVFTINDFGGKVLVDDRDRLSNKLYNYIQKMLENGIIYEHKQMFLNGDAGIRMNLYTNSSSSEEGCILKIVDHQKGIDCITPDRIYSQKCEECSYYKSNSCATGLMSLTMRADGLVSYCRLKEDDGVYIKGKESEEINAVIHEIMEAFKRCKRKE